MIFLATFILTLILSNVARAVPACGDAAPPEELYEQYEVMFDAQPIFLENATMDVKYDNWNGDTRTVTCSNLAPQFPHFHNFPQFPRIGAAFNVKQGPGCSKCWRLTDSKTRRSISLFAIDATHDGFKLGKRVFEALTGGTVEVKVEARLVPLSVCGLH